MYVVTKEAKLQAVQISVSFRAKFTPHFPLISPSLG
jgi:hypothetical protein